MRLLKGRNMPLIYYSYSEREKQAYSRGVLDTLDKVGGWMK